MAVIRSERLAEDGGGRLGLVFIGLAVSCLLLLSTGIAALWLAPQRIRFGSFWLSGPSCRFFIEPASGIRADGQVELYSRDPDGARSCLVIVARKDQVRQWGGFTLLGP